MGRRRPEARGRSGIGVGGGRGKKTDDAAAAAAAAAAKQADEAAAAGAKQADEAGAKRADEGREAVGESCSRNSFTSGTRMLRADGSTEAIDQIQAGDQVTTTDPTTGTFGHRRWPPPSPAMVRRSLWM